MTSPTDESLLDEFSKKDEILKLADSGDTKAKRVVSKLLSEGQEHLFKALQCFEAINYNAVVMINGQVKKQKVDVGEIYATHEMRYLEDWASIISEYVSIADNTSKYESIGYLKHTAGKLKKRYGIDSKGTIDNMSKDKLVNLIKENWYDDGINIPDNVQIFYLKLVR